jgi:hypothetical protein
MAKIDTKGSQRIFNICSRTFVSPIAGERALKALHDQLRSPANEPIAEPKDPAAHKPKSLP